MKKVLIITYSFPPLNNIAARRFGEIAPYLKDYGWYPKILTTNAKGTLPIKLFENQIIRLGDHPQKHTKIIKNYGRNTIKEKIFAVKRQLGCNLRMFDRTYLTWYKNILKSSEIKEDSYDIIIASYGPSASLYLGRYFSNKFNIPWIADFRDLGALYTDDSFKQNIAFKFIDKKIEKHLLSNVSGITTIGQTLGETLYKHYNKPTKVIYNGWDENQVITAKKDFFTKNRNYIYYAGRFYPHQMESIYKLLNVLRKNNDLMLIIRSLGPDILNKKLLNYARQLNLLEQIKILDPVNQNVVEKEAANSLANLVLEDLNKKHFWKKGTLTGKLLGLLPYSPPILAIARNDSEIGNILRRTNKGVLCSNEFEIEEFLSRIGRKADKYNGNPKIYDYSKENQARQLSQFLNEIIF